MRRRKCGRSTIIFKTCDYGRYQASPGNDRRAPGGAAVHVGIENGAIGAEKRGSESLQENEAEKEPLAQDDPDRLEQKRLKYEPAHLAYSVFLAPNHKNPFATLGHRRDDDCFAFGSISTV